MSEREEKTGRCLCGQVSYSVSGPPQMTAICHCKHCQRQAGSAFSVIQAVLGSDYAQSGETRIFHDTGESGRPVERHFCGECGSPILSKVAVLPDLVFLKVGTLDDTTDLRPQLEVFCDSAMAFVPDFVGTQKYPRSNV